MRAETSQMRSATRADEAGILMEHSRMRDLQVGGSLDGGRG